MAELPQRLTDREFQKFAQTSDGLTAIRTLLSADSYSVLDARYLTSISGKDHSSLANLTYAAAGHTGFEPTVTKGNLTEVQNTVVADSYASSSGSITARYLYTGNYIYIGQSFKPISSGNIATAGLYLKKTGSPTGNLVLYVYAHTGTYGSGGKPTGAILATSSVLDVSTLTTGYVLKTFTFTGANAIALTAGTPYFIIAYWSGGNSSNHVDIAGDTSTPASPALGNSANSNNGTSWTNPSVLDCGFTASITVSSLTVTGGTGAVIGSGATLQLTKVSATTSGILDVNDYSAITTAKDPTLISLAAVAGVQGDLLYASGTDIWARLAKSSSNYVLTSNGTNNNPAYGKVDLTAMVSNTLGVGYGGRGVNYATTNGVDYFNGSNFVTNSSLTYDGTVLRTSGYTTQGLYLNSAYYGDVGKFYIGGDYTSTRLSGTYGLMFDAGGSEAFRSDTSQRTLFGMTANDGSARVQVSGSVMSKSGLICGGDTTLACSELPTADCLYFDGCSYVLGCGGTHNACNTYLTEVDCNTHECTPNNGCTGTHNPCSTYDENSCSGHGCTPVYSDPYCSDPACTDQYNCERTDGWCSQGTCSDQASCECQDNSHCDNPACTDQFNCERVDGYCDNGNCNDQYNCERTDGWCSAGGCADQASCEGADNSYCDNPSCTDQTSCEGADNSYCDDPNCTNEWDCNNVCYSTWHPSTNCASTWHPSTNCASTWNWNGCHSTWHLYGCASTWHGNTCCQGTWTWNGCHSTWNPAVFQTCSGEPHACQQTECDNQTDGCYNGFIDCGGTPHACQQTECDNETDGCINNVPIGCEGEMTDTDCGDVPIADCFDLAGCHGVASIPSYIMKNDINAYENSVSNDGTNMYFETSTGIGYFAGDVSATDFINRTSVYDTLRGKALDYIKDAGGYKKNGKIDHSAFYGYKKIKVIDRTRPEIKILDGREIFHYPHTTEIEAVSLSEEIAVLRQAVFELSELVKGGKK